MIVFLILYLWHGDGTGTESAGGPSLTVTAMPSVAACEQVGAAAKKLADGQIDAVRRSRCMDTGILRETGGLCTSRPVVFRCVATDAVK